MMTCLFWRKDTPEGAEYQNIMYEYNYILKVLKYRYGCEGLSRDKLYKMSSEIDR